MFNEISREINDMAIEKGWWDEPVATFAEKLMLVVCECAEALEEYRNGHDPSEIYFKEGKPEGVPVELADIIIRVLDICGHYEIDVDEIMALKMKYNSTRSHRHGGKRL